MPDDGRRERGLDEIVRPGPSLARVRSTQTRPAFATARTGARARTDPLETRTPRAVPFGIGVVTRHAPSVEVSITSSSLLLLKRGRLESRRPAGRRGRVCGRRRGGSVWVSLRPTRPRGKAKSAADVEAAEPGRFFTRSPNDAREKAPRLIDQPEFRRRNESPAIIKKCKTNAGNNFNAVGHFLDRSLSHHDHPPATQPHLLRRLHRPRGRDEGARRDLRQMQPGKVTRLAFAFANIDRIRNATQFLSEITRC